MKSHYISHWTCSWQLHHQESRYGRSREFPTEPWLFWQSTSVDSPQIAVAALACHLRLASGWNLGPTSEKCCKNQTEGLGCDEAFTEWSEWNGQKSQEISERQKEKPKSAWQCSVVPIPRGTFGSIQMIQDSCQNLKISFQVRVASGPHNLKAGDFSPLGDSP